MTDFEAKAWALFSDEAHHGRTTIDRVADALREAYAAGVEDAAKFVREEMVTVGPHAGMYVASRIRDALLAEPEKP